MERERKRKMRCVWRERERKRRTVMRIQILKSPLYSDFIVNILRH